MASEKYGEATFIVALLECAVTRVIPVFVEKASAISDAGNLQAIFESIQALKNYSNTDESVRRLLKIVARAFSNRTRKWMRYDSTQMIWVLWYGITGFLCFFGTVHNSFDGIILNTRLNRW